MAVGESVGLVAVLAGVVLLAGGINGVAGFGFALVGTMALTMVVAPETAVVFMIVPILAVNLALARDLSVEQLQTCGRRFGPLLGAGLVGTVIGMLALDRLPTATLQVLLGLVSIGFVLNSQQVVDIPGRSWVTEGCFVERPVAMAGVGGISGLLFGGTNVGVQFVAYLKSCDLSHSLFVGVVASIFLGLNGIRIVLAGFVGLYPDTTMFLVSVAAVVPAVVGVVVGTQLRQYSTEYQRRVIVLGLVAVIGVRLLLGGLNIL